jgi:hypothetical protein
MVTLYSPRLFLPHTVQKVWGTKGGIVVCVENVPIKLALVANATYARVLATGIIIGDIHI